MSHPWKSIPPTFINAIHALLTPRPPSASVAATCCPLQASPSPAQPSPPTPANLDTIARVWNVCLDVPSMPEHQHAIVKAALWLSHAWNTTCLYVLCQAYASCYIRFVNRGLHNVPQAPMTSSDVPTGVSSVVLVECHAWGMEWLH